MKIRHPVDAVLRTSTKEVWEEHLDYVLGDKVKGRAMTGLDGSVRKTPSWQLILHYEGKLREKAAKLINESHLTGGQRHDLASAMKEARQCRETRDEEFEDKFRLQQDKEPKIRNKARGSRGRSPSPSPPRKRSRNEKGKGKGRGRSNDKEDKNNRRPPARFENKTLHREKGGKAICFPFNNRAGCKREKCTMVHACQFCLSESHGLIDCPSK